MENSYMVCHPVDYCMDVIAWGDNTVAKHICGKKTVTYIYTEHHDAMLLGVSKRRKAPEQPTSSCLQSLYVSRDSRCDKS